MSSSVATLSCSLPVHNIRYGIVFFRSDKRYRLKNLYIFSIMRTFFLLLTTSFRGRYACDAIPSSKTEDASLEEKVPYMMRHLKLLSSSCMYGVIVRHTGPTAGRDQSGPYAPRSYEIGLKRNQNSMTYFLHYP
jgi:hypothetical protein